LTERSVYATVGSQDDNPGESGVQERAMSAAIKSVLYGVQEQAGGQFMEDSGWYWTTTFGDGMAEYEAIRSGVSMWDVYGLQKWDLTGPDALAALQRVFTNDAGSLAVGQVRYGPFLNSAGKLVDDGTVYKHGDEHYWVCTNQVSFGDYFNESNAGLTYEIKNRTFEMPVLSVQGPGSRDLIGKLTDVDLHALRYFRFLPERVMVAGVPAWVLRTGFSGELGFELIPDADNAVALWSELVDVGAVPVGLDAVEMTRVEAGLVIAAVDYTPGETSPVDLSMDKLIALDAGHDFLGRAIVAAEIANPPNRFKTVQIEGDELPEYGAEVYSGDDVVGVVTSPTDTPRFGRIGLAILRTDVADNGSTVQVALGDGRANATVADLSIQDPAKRKARS
jgi:aminomethyltransferase